MAPCLTTKLDVVCKRVIYNGKFYLGNTATVFQAEITAIKKSAEMLLNSGYKNKTITFYWDSQASLAALNKLTVNSNTVEKCLDALNALGNDNQIHLRWVKAHVGIHGNQVADSLAKKGTTLGNALRLFLENFIQKCFNCNFVILD